MRIVYVFLVLLPVAGGLVYALLFSFGIIGVLAKGFNIGAWKEVLINGQFWTAIGYSFYISAFSIGISVAMALLLAISWRRNLSKGLLSMVVYLPLCFPGTVMAFYAYQLLAKSGLVSRIAIKAGLIDSLQSFPGIVNDKYGIGIIFTTVLLVTPFFIILFSNLYRSERVEEFRHLAKTFGASNSQLWLKVSIPILLSRSALTIYLFVIFVMGSYEVPLLLGRQDPQMISVSTIEKIQRYNLYDKPQGFAMALLYVVLMILALLVLYKGNKRIFKTKLS